MKKAIIFGIMALFALLFTAYAAEYDYPDIFVENENLNAVAVVGNKASSSDVLAQNTILLDIANYAGKSSTGHAKLSSEISTLNQNMILVGSACNNPITAQILGNPSPCNDGIGAGKPMIKLLKVNGYYHLVVAGYTDKETRDAAASLSKHGSLELSESKTVDDKIQEESEDEKEMLVEELNEKTESNSKKEDEANDEVTDEINETNDEPNEQDGEKNPKNNEEKATSNIIQKFINWIKLLFG